MTLRSDSLSISDLTVISVQDLEIKWDCLEESKLGGGGFADVFHVFWNGHDAVLKQSRALEYTDEVREEEHREALVVASLNNCRNVIRLYGMCTDLPFRGLVMEYCAGPNLSELVFRLYENSVRMETLRVFKWCYELTRTLCDLNLTHYHGDLKPKNVQVKERPCCCRDGEYENVEVGEKTYTLCKTCRGVHLEHISLKILDFGMAYKHGTPRKYAGTPKFAAPETRQGVYTEKSEVYSFGLLMLALVIGKPTEECNEEQTRFLKLRNNPQFDLSRCNSNSICETVTECTHDSPDLRPSFKQLLDKLNSRVAQYTSLRGDDSRSKANLEREEFLDHYKISRNLTMVHRTVTTSTLLSTSTENSVTTEPDQPPRIFYGGAFENEVFDDSPCCSVPTSRKSSQLTTSSVVENPMYTDDESVSMFPVSRSRRRRRKGVVWRFLVQAKNLINAKIAKMIKQ